MSQSWSLIIWVVVGSIILWGLALSWPSRRLRQFKVETTIAASAARVWKTICEPPGDPESALFHVQVVSVKEVAEHPPLHEYVVDLNGYGTLHRTTLIETLQTREHQYLLTRTVQLDGKPFPYGELQTEATALGAAAGGTRVTLEWNGKTACQSEMVALRGHHSRRLRQAKQFCETGRPPRQIPGLSPRQRVVVSAFAFGSYMLWLGWLGGLILTGVLMLHEFGHWLAMKITGQPAPKIILIPFFGGAALANHPHKTLFSDAFCALMGPGLSALASLGFVITAYMARAELSADEVLDLHGAAGQGPAHLGWLFKFGLIVGALNLAQMIPVLPLDGGQVLRAVMESFHRVWARRALIGLAAVGIIASGILDWPLLAVVVALGGAQALRMSEDQPRAQPMNGTGVAGIAVGYLLVLAAHGAAAYVGLTWLRLGH